MLSPPPCHCEGGRIRDSVLSGIPVTLLGPAAPCWGQAQVKPRGSDCLAGGVRRGRRRPPLPEWQLGQTASASGSNTQDPVYPPHPARAAWDGAGPGEGLHLPPGEVEGDSGKLTWQETEPSGERRLPAVPGTQFLPPPTLHPPPSHSLRCLFITATKASR